jgi:transaldolase
MEELGVEYDSVVETLETEGVEKFTSSWHELLDQVESA